MANTKISIKECHKTSLQIEGKLVQISEDKVRLWYTWKDSCIQYLDPQNPHFEPELCQEVYEPKLDTFHPATIHE